jgi:hypothetical protein
LEEEIYMKPQPGFTTAGKLLKLKKASMGSNRLHEFGI